ncbi:MAG: hypothetical protein KDC74_10110 [Flavobacteriaceae bacterium]|nr:hypothetical protein [Flavobacteriaceae bacterium]
MKTLKIEIPKGFEVASFYQESGEIKFRPTPVDVTDRIKTLDDVYADNGTSKEEFEQEYGFLPDHVKAYLQMEMIASSFNEGWEADWTDSSQRKYFQYFYMGEKSGSSGFRFSVCVYWAADSLVGSRLCFKSYELAEHTVNLFLEVYKRFHYKNQ